MSNGQKTLDVAFVGGPMYDPLYQRLPEFERRTGYWVNIGAKLIHPELNTHLETEHRAGTLAYDLISTHTKYAPSQRAFLLPLETYISDDELAAFVPATVKLVRFDGHLYGMPRNIDVRLLYYRRDLFEDPGENQAFRARFGYNLTVPRTWDELLDVARHFTRPPHLYGFAYPCRYSGLFGTFFELTAMMGGRLFNDDLSPAFANDAGEKALGYLRDLYLTYQVTPRDLPDWHFDEVANSFRAGQTAMVTDWPGGFGAMRNPAMSRVADVLDLALYPVGPTGERWVYAGGFTFAIPTSVTDLDGALKLLRFLTSEESQWHEALNGAISVRLSVQNKQKRETPPGTLEARRLDMLEQTVQQHALIPPKFATYPAVEDALWMALQTGITGQRSVREALGVAAREMGGIVHA